MKMKTTNIRKKYEKCDFQCFIPKMRFSCNVMDCHVTARGSNPGGDGVFTELHVLRKGQ